MKNQKVEASEKEHMQTLSSCLNNLLLVGFSTQFKAFPDGLLSLTNEKVYKPDQVQIVHFYRFEGESNPSDNAIVYAIETFDGEKGTLVNGYGPSSDSFVDDFMQKVDQIHQ